MIRILALLLLLTACDEPYKHKFKIGDCVIITPNNTRGMIMNTTKTLPSYRVKYYKDAYFGYDYAGVSEIDLELCKDD